MSSEKNPRLVRTRLRIHNGAAKQLSEGQKWSLSALTRMDQFPPIESCNNFLSHPENLTSSATRKRTITPWARH